MLSLALALAGPSTLFWMGVCISSSFIISLVEIAITGLIQVLLKTLGVLSPAVHGVGFFDRWEPSPARLALLLVGIGVLRAIGQFCIFQGSSVAMETISARLKLLAIHETLLDERTKSVSAARMAFNLSEVFPKASLFCYYAALVVTMFFQCSALALLMLWVAWREAAVGLVGLALIGLLIVRINQGVRRHAALIPVEQSLLTAGIERVARNWLLVQALRTKGREHRGLLDNVLKYSANSLRSNFLSNIAVAISPFFGILIIVLMLMLGRVAWHTPGMAVVSCLYLFIRFTQNLQATATNLGVLNSYFPQLTAAIAYFRRIEPDEAQKALRPSRLLSMRGLRTESAQNEWQAPRPATHTSLGPPRIEARELSFTYDGQLRPAIENLQFSVPAGAQCGLIGPSGSGKSTLLALILGILYPKTGSITIDGKRPGEILATEQFRIGYVGPDPFILEGTIRDNLDYGCQILAPTEAYWAALRKADLEQVVSQLPSGLDHRLTAQADGLSAGQKQRLALARALLNEPQILILDEPSANLDDASEAQVCDSIEKLKGITTVLVVSHRRGMLKHADMMVNLTEPSATASVTGVTGVTA